MSKLGRYRKAIAAVIGAALEIIPLAFGTAPWVPTAIAVLTAISVYAIPNIPAAPAAPEKGSTP